ncbi:MAG: PocR ligand-binding domain-containing protein [Verrucomicrobia bacterium]|nr:PocR ligand-binding domain-containing protein [Verrucomicrobiota bacterium]
MERLLTIRQLQEQLQVDRMTIYRMLSSGRLNGVKVGGQWRFREDDIRQIVAPQAGVSGASPVRQPTLPLPCWQAMQQFFSAAAEVAAIIVDPHGQPLTDFTDGCAFCSLILASAAGRQRCVKSWAALADGMNSAPRLHHCHAGLRLARATIHVDDAPLAAVVAGQALSDADPTNGQPERLAELAEACDLSLPRLQEAYSTIRRLGHAHLDKMLRLLGILGVAASRIGSERQRLVSKLDRIAQITMES